VLSHIKFKTGFFGIGRDGGVPPMPIIGIDLGTSSSADAEPSRRAGGPTRMPMVGAFFEEFVGHKGETRRVVVPMERVAKGWSR
jgi:molecular chaperone DnaK (HSP70)